MTEKKGYLKSFFKSGFFLHAALISSVMLTLLVASYEFGLLGTLMTQKHLISYVGIIVAIFAVVGILYLLISLKISHITLADAVYSAFIVVGALFTLYTAFYLKQFNIRRIVFSAAIFAVGLFLIVIRILSFKKLMKKDKAATLNNVKSYFSKVIYNFSMFGVIVTAGVTVCLAYIILNIAYGKNLKDSTFLIVAGICLIPLIVYALKGALDKRVNILDAFLLSGVISVPVVLIQIMRVAYSEMRLTLWAAVVCAYLVLYLFRFVRYDKNLKDKPIKIGCKCKIKNYYDAISSKHDPLLTIALGGFIAAVALTLLKGQAINDYLIKDGAFVFSLKGLPIMVVLIAAVGSLAFFAIVSLIGVKAKFVTAGDFFLGVCFIFTIFGFLTYFAYPSLLYLCLLIAFAVYCLIFTIARIVVVN